MHLGNFVGIARERTECLSMLATNAFDTRKRGTNFRMPGLPRQTEILRQVRRTAQQGIDTVDRRNGVE